MSAVLNNQSIPNRPGQIPRAMSFPAWSKYLLPIMILLAAMVSARAQIITFKAAVTRVTVPLNYTGVIYVTNLVQISTNGILPDGSGNITVNDINVSATASPSNPGITLGFADPFSNVLATIQGKLNTSGFKTNAMLQLSLANVPEGVYTISMNATGGATNNALLALQVGYIFAGGTNAPATGPVNFNDGTQWVGGAAPGAGDDAILADQGSQTNFLNGYSTGTTNFNTNIVFTANTTIGSMRFASTNTNFKFYNIQINDGVTVSVTGSNGFTMMRDVINVISGNAAGMYAAFAGANGTLLVSNETANVFSFIDNGVIATAGTNDFSLLGTFVTDVKQFGIGDYTLWPNYRNLNDQNNYGGVPKLSLMSINLARTNIIKAVFADPFNYTNADNRSYSISYMKSSEIAGSSVVPGFNLGITNMFYADSVLFIGANSRAGIQFNPAFAASNCYAVFRGTNGGRMSVFTQADGGATNGAQSNIKGVTTFQLGTLDMLVDRFYIGRDRRLIVLNQTPNYVGNFIMAKGIVDANTAILGFREYNQTNVQASAPLGYCSGTVTVLSNGVFKVNKLLALGQTVATNAITEESTAGNTDLGQVTIMNGGTLIANTVTVGGPSYGLSKNNFIVVSNLSTFILSNTVGSPSQLLDSLTTINGSTNQISLDGNHVGPYIYVTNLITTGSGNVIRIASLKNYSFPVQIPLIQYTGGSHTFSVIAPPGFTPNLIDNGAGSTLDVTISTNQPKNLLWRAYSSSSWDNFTPNWLDLNTGLHTNFANGDFVSFDDSPTANRSSITLDGPSSPIVSSGMTMTNSTLPYTIGGSGLIAGSVTLTKTGTSSLTVSGNTTILVQLNEGSLSGGGSIGGVNMATNTTMDFLGIINGGVTCAGTAIIDGNGIVNGSLNLLSGGVATNTVNANINGTFSTTPNSLLVNVGTITWNSGTALVSSNSTLNNIGPINGDIITFNPGSTLIDSGGANGGFGANTLTLSGSQTVTVSGTNVTYPGALFIAGGNVVGPSYVYQNNGSATIPGRLSLFQGSIAIIKVDFSNSVTNTMIFGGHLDLGGSQTKRDFNGCTVVMTNINPSAGSFADGQVFHVFGSTLAGTNIIDPTGTSTNAYPVMQPATPGTGLAWDLSHLYLAGNIGIRAVPTTGTNIIGSYTNIVANITFTTSTNGSTITTNYFTNNIILSTLTWPTNYIGWKLQSQANPLTIGLYTNWTTLLDSTFTNTISVSNNVTTNQSIFFRMMYP